MSQLHIFFQKYLKNIIWIRYQSSPESHAIWTGSNHMSGDSAVSAPWLRDDPDMSHWSSRCLIGRSPELLLLFLLLLLLVFTCSFCALTAQCALSVRHGHSTVRPHTLSPSDGLRDEGFPSHRRLRTLQPNRGRVQLVPQLRRHVESVQRRVLHFDSGLVPLQTGSAAAALHVPPQQLHQERVPEPRHPLGQRLWVQPLWALQVHVQQLGLLRECAQGEGVLHQRVGVRPRSWAPEQLCHGGKETFQAAGHLSGLCGALNL